MYIFSVQLLITTGTYVATIGEGITQFIETGNCKKTHTQNNKYIKYLHRVHI